MSLDIDRVTRCVCEKIAQNEKVAQNRAFGIFKKTARSKQFPNG
jgi:hypothetical protein